MSAPRLPACPVPGCGRAVGPSGILCRDHYMAVPGQLRTARSRARRAGDAAAEQAAAQQCIASAGGPGARDYAAVRR